MMPRHFPVIPPETIRRYDVAGPRYTSYPTAPEWTPDFGPADHAQSIWRAATESPDEPLSIYVHLPFCHSLCTFCGCNVIVSKDRSRPDQYIDLLFREMDLVASLLGQRRTLSQIHWGGGTPTFLTEAQIDRLYAGIRDRFRILPDAEVAIEVHPGHTTLGQLDLLARLGFNRLSMGVQDFDPRVQDLIGRHQSIEQTELIVNHARELGFTGINFDLIYGLPGQNPEAWGRTLDEVNRLRPDRLAVYSFAYLPTLRAQQRKIPLAELPLGPDKLGLLGQAHDAFVDRGYRPIGFDHFALPGDGLVRALNARTVGRNFQGFTVTAAPDTVAFGITGISDVAGAYAQNVRKPSEYKEALEAGHLPVERGLKLSDDDKRRRRWINQLLCNDWLRLEISELSGLGEELADLERREEEGLIDRQWLTDGALDITLTDLGRVFARHVAMVFDNRLRARQGTDRPLYSKAV
jgi:oxygen-independent coproporphyrinogen-3 oxidase